MTDEKPLNVRVAEALGWDTSPELHQRDESSEGYSACTRCGAVMAWSEPMPALCVPRYDTDWSATGRLIENYRIGLVCKATSFSHPSEQWEATRWDEPGRATIFMPGPTVLVAVCNLILALAEAGKLPRVA